MFRAELLEPSDPRWTRALGEVRHDFYHLPAYTRFSTADTDPGRALAFLAQAGDDRFFVPLIVRDLSATDHLGAGSDAVSARGYPGPLLRVATDGSGGAFGERALLALKETLSSEGIISAFVRMHPLLMPPPEMLRRHGTLVDHGDSVAIDLSETETEMWRMTEHGHRRHINKARRLGYSVRMDEHWEHFGGLVEAYAQSMERIGADERWRLTAGYFQSLREALGERAHLCVVEDRDRLCAAALITEVDGIAEYHLSGTMDDYVRMSPSKTIIDFVRRWAKERGDRVFHLAGSLQRGDALIRFKLGFSPLLQPVRSWRVVADEERYEQLTQDWSDRAGTVADPPDGFFPAYRKPT